MITDLKLTNEVKVVYYPTDRTKPECQACGFAFNSVFNGLEYGQQYQNEQAWSEVFRNHLSEVLGILGDLSGKKVVEIGCGKGFFMRMLAANGAIVTGYDPAYQGNDPSIIKAAFDENTKLDADIVILRHVLEHIPDFIGFLEDIGKANNYKGKVYIEVPNFRWILDNNAWYDIHYEHCNYFTERSLLKIFKYTDGGYLFNEQYLSVYTDMKFLRNGAFTEGITVEPNTAIWGAGAKGISFLSKYGDKIDYVVDINPAKQWKCTSTGHQIIPPEHLMNDLEWIENIIVMNPNYLKEVKAIVGDRFKLTTLWRMI